MSHRFQIRNILLGCVLLLISCREDPATEKKEFAIAVAGNECLLKEELEAMLPETGNPKDTVGIRGKIIEDWAADMLFFTEALQKLNADEIEIEKQVENYRKQLVSHIYATKIIEANLDTSVSNAEIKSYYDSNKENFILKDNIVKVNYFKIPLKAQQLTKIKRLIYSQNEKDREQLLGLCAQYADNYFVNDSTWLYLEDIKKEVPGMKTQEDVYIYPGKITEITDETFYYFLKIKEIKAKNSLSPVNFERNNIKRLIVNRRKTQLIKDYRALLLQKAKEEKVFYTGPKGKGQ